nr:hypothetical protein [Oscillospiraceae bacterium]
LLNTEGWVVCPNLSKLGGLFDVQNDTDRTNIEKAKGGSGSPTPTPTPTPTPSGDKSPSGKGDAVPINGVKSDETVDAYNPTGGPGGGSGGGGSGGGGYSDNSRYDDVTANAPGTKVYIVFLKPKATV